MDLALLAGRVGVDGRACLRSRAKSHTSNAGRRGSRPQPAPRVFGAAPQFHFFLLLGEGRKEGSGEVVFLFSVALNFGLRPA